MIGLSISPKAGSPKSRASDRVQREREEQAGPMSTAKKIILLTTGYLIIILIAVVGGNPAIQAPKGIASRRRAGWMFIHTALEVDNYLRAAEGAGMAAGGGSGAGTYIERIWCDAGHAVGAPTEVQ
eukprot:CAMPEP_0173225002 /NCGR_PEP_ID=MMETSP1142-20121109/4648_1 /TAXON_ID=483371 /ORGANISM="non described non described, Strain CCMP2298" /LENGTH=125 /DNA_ID=CAMNT_0014153323 /DNA_START=245 /DNA_END=622 /DNA_ORIENTATION=+